MRCFLVVRNVRCFASTDFPVGVEECSAVVSRSRKDARLTVLFPETGRSVSPEVLCFGRCLMRPLSGAASAPRFFENGLTPKSQGADAAPLRNLSLFVARVIVGCVESSERTC